MNTSFKKTLEFEIVGTLNELLSKHNKEVTDEIKKTVKSSSKEISKKFSKELKKANRKKASEPQKAAVVSKSRTRTRSASRRKR